MVRRILVPCDGTERCAPALAAALELARHDGATIVGLVADPLGSTGTEQPADQDPLHSQRTTDIALARDAHAYLQRRAAESGVACETIACAAPERAASIVAAARDRACDMIVLAARRDPGWRERLGGGAPWQVVRRCALPVLVVPAPADAKRDA